MTYPPQTDAPAGEARTVPNGPEALPCAACGYDLRGIVLGTNCPECGLTVACVSTTPPASGKAVAALVWGILTFFVLPLYILPAFVTGFVAIRYYKGALVSIQAGRAPYSGRAIATAGKVCAIIGMSIGSIALFVLLLAWGWALLVRYI